MVDMRILFIFFVVGLEGVPLTYPQALYSMILKEVLLIDLSIRFSSWHEVLNEEGE